MNKVRKYVGWFTGRFSGMTVAPAPSMEKFLSEFNIGDDVVVFNATDFFKWYDTTLKYMDDLKDELKDKKDIKK